MTTTAVNRHALASRYRQNRRRSRALFDLVSPQAYHSRPTSLRHPVVFYEGHLPTFSVNMFVKKALGRTGVDTRLEHLFARGIDPADELAAHATGHTEWPTRDDVRQFADACDVLVLDALENADLDERGSPLLHRTEALYAILEHEAMHHETLLYMWHQLGYDAKLPPAGWHSDVSGSTPARARATIPRGVATLGAGRDEIPFGWDNEFPAHVVEVPWFDIDVHNVTNEQFLDFIDAGGYREPSWWTPADFAWVCRDRVEHPRFWRRRDRTWKWLGMFAEIDLPPEWPVS